MRWLDFSTLKTRLLMLFLLAPLPSLGIAFYGAIQEYRTGVAETHRHAVQEVKAGSAHFQLRIAETRGLLEALAGTSAIHRGEAENCTALLSRFLRNSRDYLNLGVIRPDGNPLCSAAPLQPAGNYAHRLFFQRVLASRAFASGDYHAATPTDKPAVTLAVPLSNRAGKVEAVVFATLDLMRANEVLIDELAREGGVFTLIDERGVVLAHSPDPKNIAGKFLPQASLLVAILAKNGEGSAETGSFEGIARIHAFTTLAASQNQRVFLVADLPREGALAAAKRMIAWQAAGLVVAVALIVMIAWGGTSLFIFRPVATLIDAAKQMRAGNLSARTGIEHDHNEVSTLAGILDDMAESLELRENDRTYTIAVIKQLNSELENRVAERTTQLENAKKEVDLANERLSGSLELLQRHTDDMANLGEMGNLLQSCRTIDEANKVVAQFAERSLPYRSGGLFLIQPSRGIVDASIIWGQIPAKDRIFSPEDCWALRGGKFHWADPSHPRPCCDHVDKASCADYMCLPLMARGETMGILHLRNMSPAAHAAFDSEVQEREAQTRLQLAQYVAERTALALANLRLHDELLAQAIHDPLTGLYNRRYMEDMMAREELVAQRTGSSVGIIMIDIDHFKQLNDTYGHQAGDMVLREMGNLLESHTRGADIACRYGGEEFVVTMPGASLDITRQRAEQLRHDIAEFRLDYAGEAIKITISLGIAIIPQHGPSWDAAFRAADSALYQAKQEGRNRVIVAKAPESGSNNNSGGKKQNSNIPAPSDKGGS
ncbi:MAG: diguanylate cyclase [Sulfuricella sp.]|nr:diguanylate cyclase [Sulfuricella sp.]